MSNRPHPQGWPLEGRARSPERRTPRAPAHSRSTANACRLRGQMTQEPPACPSRCWCQNVLETRSGKQGPSAPAYGADPAGRACLREAVSGASTEPGPKVRGGHAHKGSATASCQGHPVIGGCPGGQSQCRPSLAKRQPGLPVTRPCGCLADEVPGVGTPPLHRQPEVARASPTPAPGLPRKKRGPTRDPSAQCLDGLWGAAQGTQPSSPLTGRGPVSLSNGPQWPGPHPTTSRGSPIPQARQQPLRTDKQRATGEN